MSIDVSYFSFSPSRADTQWPHFIEDVSLLRKKHASWKQYEKDSQENNKKRSEIETDFEPRIREVRKKIFGHFNDQGYIIPWIEWDSEEGQDRYGNPVHMTAEEKMEHLMLYGCVYPRGGDLGDKNIAYLMLRTDAPELEAAYKSIIEERDGAVSRFIQSPHTAPTEEKSVVLTSRQKALDDGVDMSYLKYEDAFDAKQLLSDLKYLDIYYGSVSNDGFENPRIEYNLREVLSKLLHSKSKDGVSTRDEWVHVFQNVNSEIVREAANRLAKEMGWERDEAEQEIMDYLRSVRPVVKDLKETSDAIFIISYGGAEEVEPKNIDELLLDRAKEHAEKYRGLLPPVL